MSPPPPSAAASTPGLDVADDAVDRLGRLIDAASRHLAQGDIDDHQAIAYDLAHAAAAVESARVMLAYGRRGDVESRIACAFVADAAHDVSSRILGREADFGLEARAADDALRASQEWRSASYLGSLAAEAGPRHVDPELEMVQDTFRRFAEDRVRPVAEEVHRRNADIPEDIISGLAEIGTFGLSIPAEYGGVSEGGEGEYLGMVVATEELSRGSLGVGGSLITRPEILTRALIQGGTEEQKQQWLPKLASGEIMCAVAVTEPDHGSDVAGLRVTARPRGDGWVINGVKTWCTFAARADVFLLVARTNPDADAGRRGLSMFIVPKPRGEGHAFAFTQPDGGRIEGRAIDTLGYRGMHSYEVAFEDWFVDDANLVGGAGGEGKGFYLTMQGFENGRLQTAARAIGVMQAAYEAASAYADERRVFGKPLATYQLTQVKLARMAMLIQACRQTSYHVARLLARGEGRMEASLIKAYACRAAEWVTREALQLHGGMGYAEEFPVSRYFVDARVLSVFEGADEVLALKVIARRLVEQAGSPSAG